MPSTWLTILDPNMTFNYSPNIFLFVLFPFQEKLTLSALPLKFLLSLQAQLKYHFPYFSYLEITLSPTVTCIPAFIFSCV